jgi:hypothetical protein
MEVRAHNVRHNSYSQAWWCIPIIPALGRLKQEELLNQFKTSLDNIARPPTAKKSATEELNSGAGAMTR